ncbi:MULTISPECIES: hypothetical protein [unclassified Rhodococcus (in: high G+C Gram-positive bacteria)]|uniref:hypothetical protein n=1 Tax=unclassified Rhodococcus (in: high G+C Gram-positive bacteria) TaxID=192944 RepID=UPI0007BBFFA0|nr:MULTISPECIES: hypothetical protein [unclassified Rhodococcus (in: high G+C Gram-positive bacteria)]KZF04745.1 hypothetical protein A2J04_05685 [Rhodococcus sp. EPR-279]KZF08507.1 hypothetical protein A2J02_20550 [Rhodococcus sp. EPR-147]
MDKELATLLDATSFQVADLVGPAIVIEGAANHLLSRLPETDDHRWNVTQALGSIVAARKSLESAAEALLHIVAQDGADMLAVEVNGGELMCHEFSDSVITGRTLHCIRLAGHVGHHRDRDGATWEERTQCPSRAASDLSSDLPRRCRLDAGHVGNHDDHEFRWNDSEATRCNAQTEDGFGSLLCRKKSGHLGVHCDGEGASWAVSV